MSTHYFPDRPVFRTFGQDAHGRHALTVAGGPGDVLLMVPTAVSIASKLYAATRLDEDYEPRHAADYAGAHRLYDDNGSEVGRAVVYLHGFRGFVRERYYADPNPIRIETEQVAR